MILLFIAMPLKYFTALPIAVTVAGTIHGILFIAFMVLAWEVKNNLGKKMIWFVQAFIASILPFGTLVMDREWKKEEQLL